MNATNLKAILTLFLLITLVGCQTQNIKPLKPTKPTLTIQQNNGGICLDKDNAAKLGVYILELESGYE